jgi:predicted nuclease of predicted toxin-antitoxin system
MNLSPSWIERLARHGFEAVHWSTIDPATAPNIEILTWANEHHFVVITNDLDFSASLAASGGAAPSVVQIRTQGLLSENAANTVANALEAHREDIQRGALLSIDEAGTRVRLLPLPPVARSAAARPRPDCHTALLRLPGCSRLDSRTGNRVGEPKTQEHRSPADTRTVRGVQGRIAQCTVTDALSSCQCAASHLPAGGALCRRSRVGAAVAAERGVKWGVSDPHLAAPFFAPRPALRGSLTPHMDVTTIRRDGAMPATPPNAAPVSSAVHAVRINCARVLSGSSGKLRSYQ